MITKRQIRFAMLISLMLHVLFAVGVTSILAYKRSMPPINDDFEEAINIRSNNYYSSSINTKYFSREENEPLHSGRLEGGSVWWRWIAPDECEVSFNVISPDFKHVFGVYTGALLETLGKVPISSIVDESKYNFQAIKGMTYHFVVASTLPKTSGSLEIQMSVSENDDDYVIIMPEMFETIEEEEEKKFVRTDSNELSPITPVNTNLESDKNTTAQSDSVPPADGDENMPNISGQDLPFGDLAEKDYSEGEDQGNPALPIVPQWSPEKKSMKDDSLSKEESNDNPERINNLEVSNLTEPKNSDSHFENILSEDIEDDDVKLNQEELELIESLEKKDLDSVGSNIFRKPPEPQQTEPQQTEPIKKDLPPLETAFQPETLKKRTLGKLSNLGEASLNVEETDLGHFKKKVDLAIQKSWHRARSAHADLVKYGSLKVRFWINQRGQIVDIRLLRNDADPVVVDFSISGILRAQIPPVPEKLIERTQDGKMEFEYEIIIY